MLKKIDVSITSTKVLKRVLGKKELLSIAVGQTIGSGIFALLGIGIGMTGRSISIAMFIAAFFVIVMAVPMLYVCGTIRMRGGFYTQLSLLMSEKIAGFYIIVHIISWTALAIYALSFADYALALVGGDSLNKSLISFIVLTIFYVTNLFGIQGALRVQNIMMLCMILGLTLFICFGIPQVKPEYFSGEGFMPKGISGLLAAGALMTWAVGGATSIIHLGAEAKNPTKDIPIIIIIATAVITLFYALIAVIASGVLPLEVVSGKPLSIVASQILPRPVYVFFIVGGVMFALTTTLNAAFSWVTKPILQAAVDGWFPPIIARIGKRHKAPVVILTLLYLECLIPIFFKIDIASIANMAVILTNICFAFVCFSAINMKKVIPEIWEKSKFHVSDKYLYFFSILGALSTLAQIFLLFGVLTRAEIIGNIGLVALASIYVYYRQTTGKVKMEVSYEEV